MSVAALRDLEQGRIGNPRPMTLRRLADGLGLSMTDTEVLLLYGQPGMLPDSHLWLRVLGPFTVYVDGEPVPTGSDRARLLLGTLALTPNQPVSVERLIEVTWGDRPPARAQARLRDDVARLRRRLRQLSEVVVADPGSYRLVIGDNQVDLSLFRKLSSRAQQLLRQGAPDLASRLLSDAVALRDGEPLGGLEALASDPAVIALSQEFQNTVVTYAEVAIRYGRHADVLPLLRRVVADHPLHEAANAQLMYALAAAGDPAAAVDQYEAFRSRLADEFGTDPGPEMSRARRTLPERGPESPEPPGRHVATGPGDGALRPAPGSRFVARRQLPGDLPEFTGRVRELAWLHETVAQADPYPGGPLPIVVLAGAEGIGKTRLAVHFAHQLLTAGRFPDLQLYVDMQAAGEAVLPALLDLQGVEPAQVPSDPAARGALFRHLLYHRPALLLFDNASRAEQIIPLLPAGPENLVLVTSRHSLALDGARVLHVGELPQQEASQLLSRVAGADRLARDPDGAQQLAAACRGLPRALTLAGRRLRSRTGLSPAMLARRLQRVPDPTREFTAPADDAPAARVAALPTG